MEIILKNVFTNANLLCIIINVSYTKYNLKGEKIYEDNHLQRKNIGNY